jgi:membrane-bound serine protease (ClpP class)
MSTRRYSNVVVQFLNGQNAAYAVLFTGILFIYWEFIRPGSVIPGVAGGVAAMLSLASLANHPNSLTAAALHLLAFFFFYLAARVPLAGAVGAILMALGGSMIVIPEVAILVAAPFSAISVFLFSIAVRARKAKLRLCSTAPPIYSHQ